MFEPGVPVPVTVTWSPTTTWPSVGEVMTGASSVASGVVGGTTTAAGRF